MRLLRAIHSTDPKTGGPIEGLLRSSDVLLRNGHEITLVSLESQEAVDARNFPFPVVGVGRGIGRYGYNPKLTAWVKKNAKKFDAVVIHGLWNYISFGVWRGLRGQSTPYYVFPHGMLDPWFRQKYPLKHFAKMIYWQVAEGPVLRDAKAVLFTSEQEKLQANKDFPSHNYNARVVRYGTSDPGGDSHKQEACFRAIYPQLAGRSFLLFLGRIHPKKGCDLLIRAFANALRQRIANCDLAIGGPDQAGWMNELRTLVREYRIEDRVHWLGMLEGEGKWGALRSADALILPSHQENFGIVVAEAMACGTPVLISDKVNIWREVVKTQGGIVDSDTEEGAVNLIRRFYSLSVDDQASMGKAARVGFLKYFNSEAAGEDLSNVLGFHSRPAMDLGD